MIFCDGIHLVSDESLEELHAFAAKIDIKRCWFHPSSRFPHYDVPKRRRKTILTISGITAASSRQIVAALKIMRDKVKIWEEMEAAAIENVKNFGSYEGCECDYCIGKREEHDKV